ncbi:MAG: RimK-related lysine biosynthesis protein [Inoviridae sp.]|nr:MAG: RimK-related lysine biosynthesis protein [Inoviridae sp.]
MTMTSFPSRGRSLRKRRCFPLPRQSYKLVCPVCFQIARSTDSHPALMCSRCNVAMKIAPPRISAALDDPEAIVRVDSQLFETNWDKEV